MNEHDIRNFLISYLTLKFESEQPKFLKEVFLNNFECRADLIMLGKNLHGFEIKSEIDTLKRLNLQIPHYEFSFEKVTIVCAPKHATKALTLIPDSFGLWEISDNKIKIIRNAKKKELSKAQLLRHLPVQELKNLLANEGVKKTGNRAELTIRCIEFLHKSYIRNHVSKYLTQKTKEKFEKNRSSKTSEVKDNLSLLNPAIYLSNTTTVLPRKSAKNPTPRPLHLEFDLVG